MGERIGSNEQRKFWFGVLSVVVLALSAAATTTAGDDVLTISIEMKPSQDAEATFDLETPIQVRLSNGTEHDIEIWNPAAPTGWRTLTFEWTNIESHESAITSKREVIADSFFPGDLAPPTVIIRPQQTFAINVPLLATAGGMPEWINIPEPLPEAKYSFRAKYCAPPTDTDHANIWTGDISSEPVTVAFVAKGLHGPMSHLSHNLPKTALRILQKNRHWINGNIVQHKPLHLAARFGQIEVVKWLLENGADVNATNDENCTPLHEATDPDVVKLILEYKPDLELACDFDGELNSVTPLQRAAISLFEARTETERKNWESIVNVFFAAGAECDLISAIYLNNLERVNTIMRESPPIVNDDDFPSPLRIAAKLGRLEICRYLIEQCHLDVNQFDDGSGIPIIIDALAFPDLVDLLIRSDADLERRISFRGYGPGDAFIGGEATALHWAARIGVPETIKLLIDAGVDILAQTSDTFAGVSLDQTALDVAAFYGMADNMESILKHPRFAALDKEIRQQILDRCLVTGVTPCAWEERADRPKMVRILLGYGANPNAKNETNLTPLQAAVRHLDLDYEHKNSLARNLAKLLREHGARLDLFSAVALGDELAVDALLTENPGLANSRFVQGYPLLHYAVRKNNESIVKLFLKAKADVNIQVKNESEGTPEDSTELWADERETPLHEAVKWERAEIAKILVDAGADVNAKNCYGRTPLHVAAVNGHLDLVRLLVIRGASANARDNDNKTPLQLSELEEIKQFLREHADK